MEPTYLCIDCNNLSEEGNRCRFGSVERNRMGHCKHHTDRPDAAKEAPPEGWHWVPRPDWDDFYNGQIERRKNERKKTPR